LLAVSGHIDAAPDINALTDENPVRRDFDRGMKFAIDLEWKFKIIAVIVRVSLQSG
jgi:hypothetical protein